jgi:cell division topological specificity factor
MNILNLFARKASAPVARERLQLLLAHERAKAGQSDLIAILREEILAVIAKHVPLDRDRIQVRMERGDNVSTLEVEVEVPNDNPARLKLAVNG